MATFKIDGQDIEIEPGKSVIRIAEEHGIHIPHYCWHPGLSAPANCRMCLVEIEVGGRRGMQPSCTAMPAEGMIVDTQAPAVKKNQQATMEFLLINHPLDCPVCDQAGECELQNYSYTYGPGASRFHEHKAIQPKKDIGAHVLLYSDRCIRCTRCIRFCDEVSGTSELGYFNRGVHNEIDIFPGIRLDNRLSGNTVDICPVGALLDKEFLFKQRVWFLEGTDTLCAGCSTGCNVRVDVNPVKERIYRMVPRENADVNAWWMCDDGRHGWGYVHSDERLLFPTKGRNEDEDLVLWEAALTYVRDEMTRIRKEHGPASVAALASPFLTNEEQFLFGKLVKEALSGARVALRSTVAAEGDVRFKSGFTIRADKSPNSRGAREILGSLGLHLEPSEEIWSGVREGKIRALLYAGGDPVPAFTQAELGAIGSLELLVVQDILKSDLSRAAHVVLPGAAFAEKDGTFTNHAGRVQQLRPALKPPGDARPDWMILQDLGNALGGQMAVSSAADVMAAVAREIRGYAGVSQDALGTVGLQIAGA
jgi:NADH-quinone oxidoreductase subunit G